MLFVECAAPEDLGLKSKSNQGQANLCRQICTMLCADTTGIPTGSKLKAPKTAQQHSIAVLTPYSRQAELLKRGLGHLNHVEVSSIDGFQGREADIAIFVTVRGKFYHEIGFLKDLRRMNVVLTRARAGVIVIRHRETHTGGSGEEQSTLVWKKLLSSLTEVAVDTMGVT
jgi:superfamily I DNA and/or RNA helicase